MLSFDLESAQGQQEFQRWVTEIIRKEVNSYIRTVLFQRDSTYIDTGTLTTDQRVARLEQALFRG